MKVIPTEIEGVVILEPDVFGDARGYFFESYSEQSFGRLVRPVRFVQDNESMSKYGVLRGLHFQRGRMHSRNWCALSGAACWTSLWTSAGARPRSGGTSPWSSRGQQTAVLRTAGLRARLLGAERRGCIPIQVRQPLCPRIGGRHRVGRPRAGYRLAPGTGGCRPLAQGQRPPAAGRGRGTVRL